MGVYMYVLQISEKRYNLKSNYLVSSLLKPAFNVNLHQQNGDQGFNQNLSKTLPAVENFDWAVQTCPLNFKRMLFLDSIEEQSELSFATLQIS